MDIYALILLWILCGGVITISIMFTLGYVKLITDFIGDELFRFSIIIGGPIVWAVVYLGTLRSAPAYDRIK